MQGAGGQTPWTIIYASWWLHFWTCFVTQVNLMSSLYFINLSLQIKDLKQDFVFKSPKKTSTAVFTHLWSTNNPIYWFKKMHILNLSYMGFYSHRFRKNHLPNDISLSNYFWLILKKIIILQITNRKELLAIRKRIQMQSKLSTMDIISDHILWHTSAPNKGNGRTQTTEM